jgi:three-Cys-motif partner protein
MSVDPVTWERDDHTAAKHDLLRAFFNKWVSVHSEWFAARGGGLVRIYDGFAGPGVYSGREAESPVILLRALCTHPRLLAYWTAVDYELRFVEMNEDRARMLNDQLREQEAKLRTAGTWSERINWSVTCGRYEDHVPQPIARPSALFLFLDPFGYSHSPMALTHELVQQPKSDTLIFLPLSFVNRFAGLSSQERALDRFFGTREWRDVPDGPGRPRALLDLFMDQLRKAGLDMALAFRIRPEERSNEYWIVGASSHPQGFASIKEGFWAVDPVNGQGFAAPRSTLAGQDTLFGDLPQDANTEPLLELLRERFDHKWFSVEDAMAVTACSRFLDSHLKQKTLRPAEQAGRLEVERPPGARQFKEGRGIRLRFT